MENKTNMTAPGPLTPPPELVQQWLCSDDYLWGPLEQTSITITTNRLQNVAAKAAQWGADQELEACVNWLADPCAADMPSLASDLRYSRRPKPPTLKEQALAKTTSILNDPSRALLTEVREILELNLRALEALPND